MGKCLWSLIATVFSENETLFKVRPRTGSHVHRKSSNIKKLCKIDTLLRHITNRKYHIAYRFVPFPITFNDLEGHSPVAWNAHRGTFVQHFARFQLTRRVARSLGDSWVCCWSCTSSVTACHSLPASSHPNVCTACWHDAGSYQSWADPWVKLG